MARDTSLPAISRGSRDEAGNEEAHQRKRPGLFWMGGEGWLRQRVSDGKENYCIAAKCSNVHAHYIVIEVYWRVQRASCREVVIAILFC